MLRGGVDWWGEAFLADALAEIDLMAHGEIRIDQPGVDADQFGKLLRYLVVSGEMLRLAPHMPACR